MEEQIKEALEEIRGMLQADGGDLELVAIEGLTVKVRLTGACGSCPHAMITLKQGVEEFLKEKVDPKIIVERAE
ncbi:MAG: NifU family protein [Kiritimatiellae bacterium]|nr:NifU family protein [Kiritimatiellia bacterium]